MQADERRTSNGRLMVIWYNVIVMTQGITLYTFVQRVIEHPVSLFTPCLYVVLNKCLMHPNISCHYYLLYYKLGLAIFNKVISKSIS